MCLSAVTGLVSEFDTYLTNRGTCSLIIQICVIWSHKGTTFLSSCQENVVTDYFYAGSRAVVRVSPSKVCALWQETKKKKRGSVELNAPYTCATRNIVHHQQRSVIMCMRAVDRSNHICSRAGRSRCLSGSEARLDAFHSCHTTEKKKKRR